MWTERVGDRITNPTINGQPTLPPELLPNNYVISGLEYICIRVVDRKKHSFSFYFAKILDLCATCFCMFSWPVCVC